MERIAASPVPVAIWVGPSGARLYGTPAQLLAVADVSGMAPGARVGHSGIPLRPNGQTVDFGAADDALRSGSLGLSDARRLGVFDQRVSDEGVPTIVNMVDALDGYEKDGVTLHTTERGDARRRHGRAGTRSPPSASPSSASSTSCSTPSPARPSPTCCS